MTTVSPTTTSKVFAAMLLLLLLLPNLSMARRLGQQPPEQKGGYRFAPPGLGIPNQHIVVLKDTVTDVRGRANMLLRGMAGAQMGHVYEHALKGFVVSGVMPNVVKLLLNNPMVDFIEQDAIVQASEVQTGVSAWGLDRIDQASLPLTTTYSYNCTGSGIKIYILDTGIRMTHTEFINPLDGSSRAICGWNFVSNNTNCTDDNGHGTHVAGIAGGNTVGVAKNVTLVAVKVMNAKGSGSNSNIIAGINFVLADISTTVLRKVINMSLGANGTLSGMDTAVNNAAATGVTVVVAAGNFMRNACDTSPARAALAVTVGATTETDAMASFSNYGPCVDIWAPGSRILSSYFRNDTDRITQPGTSMAAPHVAGVAALYLQGNLNSTDAINAGVRDKLTALGPNSTNLLLNTQGINFC